MTWDVREGDCRELLRAMPAESVHCVVTSPPYWGLRDYGLPPLVWGGDAEGCEHEWEMRERKHPLDRGGEYGGGKQLTSVGSVTCEDPIREGFCRHCHAWRGSLGLEPTPELYIEHMVEVFREVKRVLRSDGTCWVNMGDSYTTRMFSHDSLRTVPVTNGEWCKQGQRGVFDGIQPPTSFSGLKPKDLCGMPWRLAFALQADGWWLRSEIIWSKPNPMPESVRDRPTKAHETVFLLTKAARYFYDQEAVREPIVRQWEPETNHPAQLRGEGKNWAEADTRRPPHGFKALPNPAGRNRRTVWTIPTAAFPGAHFATFPPALIEPMILTSPTKCCAACGKGWERVTERTEQVNRSMKGSRFDRGKNTIAQPGAQEGERYTTTTLGFAPGCECGSEETVPATVLDIFCGSGTTPMVALRHARNAVGLELSEEYAEMARRRIVDDSPLWNSA